MRYRASRTALLGILFALSLVLSFFESAFAGLIPIPGFKPGLSNIVVMYCLFFLGSREAYILAILKAAFVLMTRGWVGACMSLSGGLVSVTVMLVLYLCKRKDDLFCSVCGGLAHNVGQLLMASLVLKSNAVFYYFPVLAIAGIGMGILTGMVLRYLRPHFERLFPGRG